MQTVLCWQRVFIYFTKKEPNICCLYKNGLLSFKLVYKYATEKEVGCVIDDSCCLLCFFQRPSTVMRQCFHFTVKENQIRERSRNQKVIHPETAGEFVDTLQAFVQCIVLSTYCLFDIYRWGIFLKNNNVCFGFRSVHNELEKHRYFFKQVFWFCLYTVHIWTQCGCVCACRRAQLRNCLDQLKQQVPLSSDSSRNTTLNLLRQAQVHIKVSSFLVHLKPNMSFLNTHDFNLNFMIHIWYTNPPTWCDFIKNNIS